MKSLIVAPLLLATTFAADTSLFDQSNFAAWCIVPFDRAKRGPEQRAEMLEKLQFTKFVYDYRKEHIPSFDAELTALKQHHVELLGWWFPGQLNDEARLALDLFKRHDVHPQLWVTGSGARPTTKAETAARIAAEVARIKPIAEAAQAQGCKVALYNHGGWFGEPETQIVIIEALGMKNVGIVYNLHHGHHQAPRLRQLLALMKPHLLCLNLNGMMEDGEARGMKIVPIGQGEQDLDLLRIIAESGYRGPIGILNHTDEDAEERLLDNLEGLRWLVKSLKGEPPGEQPKPRSWTRPAEKTKATRGPSTEPSLNATFGKALRGRFDAGEKASFRTRPFTIECRAKMDSKTSFNILVARDVKASADHWELYTTAKSGTLAFYQPGRGGVVNSSTDVCDGRWHQLAATVDDTRVQLFVDGKLVADAAANAMKGEVKPGSLCIGGLVESSILCDGLIDNVRLSSGIRAPTASDQPLASDAQTIELWDFEQLTATAPTAQPARYFYEFGPLKPDLWPQHTEEVNHYRLYDFYAKQALAFKGKPLPSLLPGYPGLDGGLFGHWGYAFEDAWRDARWDQAQRAPLQSGVLWIGREAFPKAVVIQIGDAGELTTAFDPLTLSFIATSPQFVKMGDSRHGMMNGLRFPGAAEKLPAAPQSGSYLGFYRHGAKVIFRYRIGQSESLTHAWVKEGRIEQQTCAADAEPLAALTKGGPASWPEWLTTKGTLGTAKPYTIDTLALPKHPHGHPWFISGHDFFPDGSAALCTMTGDVWLVRGIDDSLQTLRWKRFASGLHQPLGLRIVDGQICVQGRDQITRLHDLNADDEADFYECVTNAMTTAPGGHDYITGCEYDGTHFYFASANQGVCRVRPGEPVEVLATGLRNPNGLGLARDTTLTSSVQEGDWTPASAIMQIKRGDYFGHGGKPQPVTPPLCYFPRGVDNSCGGQCFTESTRWGPLGGQLIHFSPGAANHFLILRQTIGDITQGAAVWLPGDFRSGAQQGRINAHDGQLYVSGMYGWGCWAPDDGCFQRVRYTGGPAHLPVSFALHENGVFVRFSDPLGSEASDVKQHFAQCWNYRFSRAYGSPELSLSHPDIEGHDTLAITSAHLSEAGKALFLEMPMLTPCNQLHVHVSTGKDRYQDLYITAHKLAPPFTAYPGYKPSAKQYILAQTTATEAKSKPNPWTSGAKGRALTIAAAPGLKFAPTELRAKVGERLSITFTNPDVLPHNWALIAPGQLQAIGDAANKLIATGLAQHYVPGSPHVLAYTDMVNPGGEFTIHIDAPKSPGRYPYLCTFPGHWLVMNGVMVVE